MSGHGDDEANDHAPWRNGALRVSDNGRFLQHQNGKPFFWLADTAWLLHKLGPDDVAGYLADRSRKQYNVAQLQVVPGSLDYENYAGDQPFVDRQIQRPNEPYWTYIDHLVDEAARFGIYLGMDAVWGSVVTSGTMTTADATWYGSWLGERYRDRPNIIWLNGGDTLAHTNLDQWNALGRAIKAADPQHLMTFHPFGRYSSSTWFHTADWLDFNMFQSGHRDYAQSFAAVGTDVAGVDLPTLWRGEDNWRNVIVDYGLYPPRPTVDGEPSYEGIPHGLHDPTQPWWTADDARRYAYWSVFAGAFGHTYGNGSVMQFFEPSDGAAGGYGVTKPWRKAIDDPGAGQLQYLKKLILSRPYFERIYDPTVVAGDPGYRYHRLLTTRGDSYLFAYIHTGRAFSLQLGQLTGDRLNGWWFDPRTGAAESIGRLANEGVRTFDPPGRPADGNDWVLVLDDADQGFAPPGSEA